MKPKTMIQLFKSGAGIGRGGPSVRNLAHLPFHRVMAYQAEGTLRAVMDITHVVGRGFAAFLVLLLHLIAWPLLIPLGAWILRRRSRRECERFDALSPPTSNSRRDPWTVA